MTRRAPTRVLVLLCLFGGGPVACSGDSPKILDVSLLQDTADPAGPFRFEVVTTGGDHPVSARVIVAIDGADSLLETCGDAFPRAPGRNVDASAQDPVDCVSIELNRRGEETFTGHLPAAPFPLGTRVHYQVRVVDGDGDAARWPAEGSALFIVGPNRDAPALTDIAPRSGPASGGTIVLLRGERFGPDVQVRVGGSLAASVRVESPHLLEIVTPPGDSGATDIVVVRGPFEARLGDAFRYIAPPVVQTLSPAFGPVQQATFLVIEGAGFEMGAQAFFDGIAAESMVLAPDRLATFAPPAPASVALVAVENPDLQRSDSLPFEYLPPPVLTAIEPGRGPDLGGEIVALTGRDLRSPGAVWLGERAGLDVQVNADGTGATFISPISVEGLFDVRFYNPDGQFAELVAGYRFLGPPLVEAIDPPEVSRCGGGLATLLGRNFDPEMEAFFDDVQLEIVEVAEDGLSATVRIPPHDIGPVRVTVRGSDGRVFRADGLVAYTTQPSITAVAPMRVPVWGGTLVVVEGGDFEAGAEVQFGGVRAEATNFLAEGCEGRIEAVVPPGDPGLVGVSVRNPDGREARVEDLVEYVAPVIEPALGLVPGYANVTLSGVDLRPGLRVRFGERAPRSADRESDETWRLVTPPGEPGLVQVEIRNADGRGTVLELFTYQRFLDDERDRLDPIGDCNDTAMADLDGDGDLDFVAANGALAGAARLEQEIGIHLNDGRGRFARSGLRPIGHGMNATLGDIDADGDLDLYVANLSSSSSHMFRNDGRGRFAEFAGFPGRKSAYDAELFDTDGDGDIDLFSLQTGTPGNNAVDGPEEIFINDGAGRFVEDSDGVDFEITDVHDHDVAIGDLNGDGLLDLIIVVDNLSAGFDGAANRILLNRGGNVFERIDSPIDQYPGDWLNTAIADLDADGDLDLIFPQNYLDGFSRPGTPPLAVYLNDGQANFVEATERVRGMPAVPSFEAIVHDLDLDGDVDLIVAVYGVAFGDGTIDPFRSVILLNDGDAQFHESSSAFSERRLIASTNFEVGDLDGDGDFDLIECAAGRESRVWIQDAR